MQNQNISFAPGRLISRNSDDVTWPPRSPDLNPLDYFFWGVCEAQVFENKPQSIDELKEIVTEASQSIEYDVIMSVTANLRRRAELCLQENGGFFEHLL